jgi:hypothetical protein
MSVGPDAEPATIVDVVDVEESVPFVTTALTVEPFKSIPDVEYSIEGPAVAPRVISRTLPVEAARSSPMI